MRPIFIVKADGKRESFSSNKLYHSMIKSGADEKTAGSIVDHLNAEIKDGMSTHDIYTHAFHLLHNSHKPAALTYSLRRSLTDFGPSGFPFEKFIGEIWKKKGYSIKIDAVARGRCTEHEIDVVAWNEDNLIMTEAKFHHQLGVKSDLKVALYVKARYDDLTGATFTTFGKPRTLDEGWLVTNTKFTHSAIEYAECQKLKIIGWNYPQKGNLQDMIEESGLHPLTCLNTINVAEKRDLMKNGLVICDNLRTDSQPLLSIGIKPERISRIVEESALLC